MSLAIEEARAAASAPPKKSPRKATRAVRKR
jgi:hypothetical protein